MINEDHVQNDTPLWASCPSPSSTACSYSDSIRSSFLLFFTPHMVTPLHFPRICPACTSFSTLTVELKSLQPYPTFPICKQQSVYSRNLLRTVSEMVGGRVIRMVTCEDRARQRRACRNPDSAVSWQKYEGRVEIRIFLCRESFSFSCAFTKSSSMRRQKSGREQLGNSRPRIKSPVTSSTSLLRSRKLTSSLRTNSFRLICILSYLQAISDFWSGLFSDASGWSLRTGEIRCLHFWGVESQIRVGTFLWQLDPTQQRSSDKQLVLGWSSSSTIMWPLVRELKKTASRSGCPKKAFWELEAPFSAFLNEDFIGLSEELSNIYCASQPARATSAFWADDGCRAIYGNFQMSLLASGRQTGRTSSSPVCPKYMVDQSWEQLELSLVYLPKQTLQKWISHSSSLCR